MGCLSESVPQKTFEDTPLVSFKRYVVKRGDIFSAALDSLEGVPDSIKSAFLSYLLDSVRILHPKDTLQAVYLDGKLARLELRKKEVVYTLQEDKFLKKDRFRLLVPEYVELEVKTTLWDAFLEKGLSPQLLVNLVDIYAWKVDFSTETRRGDSLKVLYAPDGTVYYAEYIGKSVGKIVVVRFLGSYYDEEGNSVRRTFLKSPLKYYRVTSRFGIRFHPILKVWRPHHGLDYAAPYGSPVRAVADGKVVFAGWKGGYGKTVIIKHRNGYETLYGHMSKIFVRVGQAVEQGQLIGAVGSTGLSTGPHLHYEVRLYGRKINPALIKSEPEKPLPDEMREEFYSMLSEYRRLMGSPEIAAR